MVLFRDSMLSIFEAVIVFAVRVASAAGRLIQLSFVQLDVGQLRHVRLGFFFGKVKVIDRGIPYDPLKKADPDVTLSADEREIGGLGIFIAKKVMDSIAYEYKNGQNILRIKKTI